MMVMRKHAALRIGPIALLLGVGCAELLQPGEVLIRVRNTGSVDFERVTLGFPSQTELYGSLARAETTPYRTIEKAYTYSYVEVMAGGQRYVLQPIDYVGETPLRGGSYTYELSLLPSGSLSFQFVRD